MKNLLIIIVFLVSSTIVFAQELKDPTLKAPFTESSGNFLVLTSFDKIGKSDITIDYIKNLRQELNDSKKTISEQKQQLNENKKTISEQQKQINEQKKELEELKKSITQLARKVEDLEKKVK
ncbi:MAG: hypothetical protein LBU83_00980 [Bacteroidales bacterium]|jgi:peptidoglycan hydrolase CwlO-like protein|nr:hypothetical protein [Bacteroidales bacterium]